MVGRSWAERIGVPDSLAPLPADLDRTALPGGADWGPVMEQVRELLDLVAGARLEGPQARRLVEDLAAWNAELAEVQGGEIGQPWGRRADLPARGQALAPHFELVDRARGRLRGRVAFGRFHLGGNGAVHGGAVALFFDELLGRMSSTDGRPASRTASLAVDFRAITPIDRPLEVEAWVQAEHGRKVTLRAEIRDGDLLCAEAEGLFVSLRADQA